VSKLHQIRQTEGSPKQSGFAVKIMMNQQEHVQLKQADVKLL
jgi:hypothetical protein